MQSYLLLGVTIAISVALGHVIALYFTEWLSERSSQRFVRWSRETDPHAVLRDYRDTVDALVHKDLRLQFDGNRYCVPHRFVGRRLTVKADASSVTVYHRYQEIVSYARSWRRGKTFGAERFERELAEQRPAARRSQAQRRFLDFLDGLCAPDVAEGYLRGVADSDRVLSRQLNELLELIRQPILAGQVPTLATYATATATVLGTAAAAGLMLVRLQRRLIFHL